MDLRGIERGREMRERGGIRRILASGDRLQRDRYLTYYVMSSHRNLIQLEQAMNIGTYHKYLQRALVHVRTSSWVGWVARQCNYRNYRHLNGKGPQASNKAASRWMGEGRERKERGARSEAPLKRGTITQPMRWHVYPLRICKTPSLILSK